ncbi:MAG: hypothetical protein ACE5K3_02295 [bacterium]
MADRKGFKEKVDELFPWEEGKKKRQPQRMDSIPPNTSLKSKVHSKPKIQGQEYLDLYMMMKEKARLERYGETLAKIQLETGKQWKDMKKTLKKVEKNLPSVDETEGIVDKKQEASPEKGEKVNKKRTPSNLKKVDWSY